MSITVRLWTPTELESIKSGKNKWLATIFMNVQTFTEEEIKFYPYNLRRTFLCEWNDEPEPIEVYATDVKNLYKFLKAEYTRMPDWIAEVLTRYKRIRYSNDNLETVDAKVK